MCFWEQAYCCLLYTSDAADERSSVDLGGRRIIKKKTRFKQVRYLLHVRQKRKKAAGGKGEIMNINVVL